MEQSSIYVDEMPDSVNMNAPIKSTCISQTQEYICHQNPKDRFKINKDPTWSISQSDPCSLCTKIDNKGVFPYGTIIYIADVKTRVEQTTNYATIQTYDVQYELNHQIRQSKAHIGRNLKNDIILPYPNVTKMHALITFKEKEFEIKDNPLHHSTNHIWVNNPLPIQISQNKCHIKVGKTYLLVYIKSTSLGYTDKDKTTNLENPNAKTNLPSTTHLGTLEDTKTLDLSGKCTSNGKTKEIGVTTQITSQPGQEIIDKDTLEEWNDEGSITPRIVNAPSYEDDLLEKLVELLENDVNKRHELFLASVEGINKIDEEWITNIYEYIPNSKLFSKAYWNTVILKFKKKEIAMNWVLNNSDALHLNGSN